MKTPTLPLMLLCALLVSSPARAQPAASAPAGRFLVTPDRNGAQARFYLAFEVPEKADGPTGFDVLATIEAVRQTLPPGIGLNSGGLVGDNRLLYQMTLLLSGEPLPAYGDAAIQLIVDRFNDLTKSRPLLAPQALEARLKELDAQRWKLDDQREVAGALLEAQGNARSLLKDKLAQLRSAQQTLKMELSAKEARRKALSEAIQVQKLRVDNEVAGDLLTKELMGLVKAREAAVAIERRRAENGPDRAGGEASIISAEAALAEARIRLAERQALLGKSGKGDLIDRLSDELAMISVDATDLQIRAEQVESELRSYDIRAINSDALSQFSQQYQLLLRQNGDTLPIFNEINKKQAQLALERFKLKVMSVSALSTQDYLTIPASAVRDGRGGGGGGRGAGGRGARGPATSPSPAAP